MKKITALLLIFCLNNFLFTSCASKKYSDSYSCDELSRSILGDAAEEYSFYSEDYPSFFFDAEGLYDSCAIAYSTEVNDINELGVFHLKKGASIEKLSESAERYLSEMLESKRAFISSYAPEEIPKLENAKVRVFGNYVIYAIMDSEDRSSAFMKAEELLSTRS